MASFVIIVLGSFLRLFRIEDNLVFHGELGHNYLAIKNFVLNREIPLLGPPTSHPWLSFGPLYYWIFGPFLAFFGYDPLVGAYFFALVGVLLLIINYAIVKKLFGKRIAILSSYLIAISPLWLKLTREARFFSLVPLFFYLFLFFLLKGLRENSKYLFWTGFFLGVMLNFHLTSVIFIPAILTLVFLKREKIKKMSLIKGTIGLLIPNIPFLLYNLTHGFKMMAKFVVWVPYRIAGFVGLYPKNAATFSVIKDNIVSLYEFFVFSFLPEADIFALFLFLAVMIFFVLETRDKLLKKRKDLVWLTTILIFAWGYLGIFLHGAPPRHYYLPLYPLPILFLSVLLNKFLKKKVTSFLSIMVLVVVTVFNLSYFFSSEWFYLPQDKVVENQVVPYDLQVRVAKAIIKDADKREYSLSRVGPYDYFDGNYAQNYQYLLWLFGNEPTSQADLRYTIYEDVSKLPSEDGRQIVWISNMAVLKEELKE